jgi:membrane protease YdiL (CAAX protease family)
MTFGVYNQVIAEIIVLLIFIGFAAAFSFRDLKWKWLAAAIVFFSAQKIIVFLGVAGVLPDLVPGRYNWEGKILSLLFTAIVAFLFFREKPEEWGFTLSQNGEARTAGISVAIFTAIAGTLVSLLYFEGVRTGPANEWLYQLTMPSIEEELIDRGILLLMLDRAFGRRWKIAGVTLGWGAVIMTLMFYMSHVLRVDGDWNLIIVWGDYLPGIYGLLWMYIRLATGSLALPIILHGWINVAGFIL